MVSLEALPALPSPPNGDYSLEILSTLGTILLIVLGLVVREYLRVRNEQSNADRDFRDKQIAMQEKHYQDVTAARDAFRTNYEANTNERLDGFESAIKTLSSDLQSILAEQQKQLSAIDKELYRLISKEENSKKPPMEGGK